MKVTLLVSLAVCTSVSLQQAQASKCIGADPCNACHTCEYCKRCAQMGGNYGVCKAGRGIHLHTVSATASKRKSTK